jgi:hypothetical protein
MMNARHILPIRFANGCEPQEVRFVKPPKSLRLVNRDGWAHLYVNGRPYVAFHAEAVAPFEEASA